MFHPDQDDFKTTLARASQVQRQRQDLALKERAEIIERSKNLLGTYTAVAEQMGVTPAAITDTRERAAKAIIGPPMPHHIDLSLRTSGGRVWTVEEWKELEDPDHRSQAARVTAAFWGARASIFHTLWEKLRQGQGGMSEAVQEEWTTTRELRTLVAEGGAPEWAPHMLGKDDLMAYLRLLDDLTKGFAEEFHRSWEQADRWRSRAEDPKIL